MGVGVGIDADHLRGAAGEHVGAVALAAGEIGDRRAADPLRDPLVDGEVAAKPVVLLRHIGQRALTGERQRRHAVGLILLQVDLFHGAGP